MTDKLVTHEDRDAIAYLIGLIGPITDADPKTMSAAADFLGRAAAAAEADQPPLPEGWVIREDGGAHYHRDGEMFTNADCRTRTWSREDAMAQEWTPLRPAVTESQIKAAAEDCLCGPSTIRQHLAAVGIEVAK